MNNQVILNNLKLDATFLQLLKLITKEIKNNYPTNQNVIDFDINYLINKQGFSVVDIFTTLDIVNYERENPFKWSDMVYNNFSDSEVIDLLVEGLKLDLLGYDYKVLNND